MSDFKNNIKKVTQKRVHSINNSYGIKDAFVFYKNNRPKDKEFVITDSKYRLFIREVNRRVINHLLTYGNIKLPVDVGELRIYRQSNKPIIVDNKVVYKAPIDWNKTLDLWEKDNESKIAKILVKVNPGYIYKIKYKNTFCKFKNKGYYVFKPSRNMKQLLKEQISKKKDIPYYTNFKKI